MTRVGLSLPRVSQTASHCLGELAGQKRDVKNEGTSYDIIVNKGRRFAPQRLKPGNRLKRKGFLSLRLYTARALRADGACPGRCLSRRERVAPQGTGGCRGVRSGPRSRAGANPRRRTRPSASGFPRTFSERNYAGTLAARGLRARSPWRVQVHVPTGPDDSRRSRRACSEPGQCRHHESEDFKIIARQDIEDTVAEEITLWNMDLPSSPSNWRTPDKWAHSLHARLHCPRLAQGRPSGKAGSSR